MIGRPKVPLVLTTPEQQALDSLAHRARTAPQVARRARIVLACARGLDNQTVAKKLRVSPQMVGRWRARFVTRRVDGLLDEPRPGAPRTITDDTVEAVIVRTLETTPDGATHWSTRTLAKATGLSHGTIARIWRAFGLQPHRTKTFTLSPDPLLVEKVRDVVGLYLHPPDHALVLCVDEKSQIQALDRTQPLLPMQPGQTARHTHTYRRHGTTSLFAALDAQSGQVIGRTYRRHRAIEFRKFLDLIDAMSGARPRRPPDPRQLQHPQNAADPPVVGQAPTLPSAFHADLFFVAQLGGTLVRGTDDEAAPPWDASERAAVGGRHLGVPRHQQCRRQAVRLDEKRR